MTSVEAPHREKWIQLDDSGGHCCWLCGPALFDHLVLVAKEETTKVTCYVYLTCYTRAPTVPLSEVWIKLIISRLKSLAWSKSAIEIKWPPMHLYPEFWSTNKNQETEKTRPLVSWIASLALTSTEFELVIRLLFSGIGQQFSSSASYFDFRSTCVSFGHPLTWTYVGFSGFQIRT